jgi:hypothetical protein
MQLSTTHYGNPGNIWWSYQVSTGRIFTDFKGLTFKGKQINVVISWLTPDSIGRLSKRVDSKMVRAPMLSE